MKRSEASSSNEESTPSTLEGPLWQLIINEARLHSERTSFFLLANSFLLTGFAVLRQNAHSGIEFVPAAVGIAFSILHLININYGESVLKLWEQTLRGKSHVAHLIFKERDDLFQRNWWLRKPLGRLTRNIGSCVFPVLFLLMWIALVVIEAMA